MSFTAPPGVFDILPKAQPDVWRSSHLWTYVEKMARRQAQLFGFEEIRTPLFEREELFVRSVGEATDIVAKEMYTFTDRGERRLALRPEGTAPVMRAFVEHHLDQQGSQHKLFYIAPMFRYERAQAGRYRQHHQFGVEAIGVATPAQDVEVIDLLWGFYRELGLQQLSLQLNCLGDSTARSTYRSALVEYLTRYQTDLSPDSQRRLIANPLRILDSKEASDQAILGDAPRLIDHLAAPTRSYFDAVCALLEAIGIPYHVNHRLVRGLDYYNGVVFEVTSSALGAQNSIGGGGRYDGMLKAMGGADLPTFGFGTGLERVIQTLLAQGSAPSAAAGPLIYFVPLGEAALNACFALLHKLRATGIAAQMELGGRKLNKAMHHAHALGAHYTAVVGDDELASQSTQLKHMGTGTQNVVSFDALEGILKAIPLPTAGV